MSRHTRRSGAPDPTRRGFLRGMGVALGGALIGRASADGGPVVEETAPLLQDGFDGPDLNEALWTHTAHNDFETSIVDILGGRLRIACSTIGTDDTTVKYHGVRSAEPVVPASEGAAVSCLLDWNAPANGCYMHAGIYLSPEAADNPADLDDRLEFVYIGVPPGQTARGWATLRQGGLQPVILLDEGWPRNRAGRSIGLQSVSLEVVRGRVSLKENGETILTVGDLNLDWGWVYLYLQQSSHSNYPLRTVFFDDVCVSRLGAYAE